MVPNVGRGKARRVRGGGRTKKEAFSRCKIYDVQVSTRGEEGGKGGGRSRRRRRVNAEPEEFSSLNRWKIDGDADESVPVSIFLPSFLPLVDGEWPFTSAQG